MDTGLASIIIPVWNTGEKAVALVRNILAQSYHNLEVIVIDDGSSDNSLELLRQIKDKRVVVLRQNNAGAAAARNRGLERARGKYIFFMDSDDDILPGLIEKMINTINSDPRSILAVAGIRYKKLALNTVNDVYIKSPRARRRSEKMVDYILWLMIRDGRMYSLLNKVFRREIIEKANLRFETGRDFAEDTQFVLNYIAAAIKQKEYQMGEIVFLDEALYQYNFGTETSTVKHSSLIWQNWEKSYSDTRNWAKTVGPSAKTPVLLKLLKLRWRISYYRSKKRARL